MIVATVFTALRLRGEPRVKVAEGAEINLLQREIYNRVYALSFLRHRRRHEDMFHLASANFGRRWSQPMTVL